MTSMSGDMTLNEYQDIAQETAIYPPQTGILYTALGLTSEAGEVAGKVKKAIRDNDGRFSMAVLDAIADEVGDVLWYVANLTRELGLDLETVAQNNVTKLASRKARGVIGGSGDTR